MKRCPYCAEEIQDAAIVYKHCGRDIVAQGQAPAAKPVEQIVEVRKKTPWVMGLVVLTGVLIAVAFLSRPTPSTPTERILRISAGRGLLSASITNRESSPLIEITTG